VRLWRISNYADLSGEGGRRVSARWHTAGRPVVYLAEHPALALVENLVNLQVEPDDLPDTYQLLEVEVPDELAAEKITLGELAGRKTDWRRDLAYTRSLGDAWLAAGRTALLRVPSAVVPSSENALLNPAHPGAAAARIVAVTRPAYDGRLLTAKP
jgi:RES domain-containing protein